MNSGLTQAYPGGAHSIAFEAKLTKRELTLEDADCVLYADLTVRWRLNLYCNAQGLEETDISILGVTGGMSYKNWPAEGDDSLEGPEPTNIEIEYNAPMAHQSVQSVLGQVTKTDFLKMRPWTVSVEFDSKHASLRGLFVRNVSVHVAKHKLVIDFTP